MYVGICAHAWPSPDSWQWERHCAELPWGRPEPEEQWRLLDVPDDLVPWCAEVRPLRRPDALLRTLLFHGEGPAAADGAEPDQVVFLPGWASTPYSWRQVLPTLAGLHPTWYLETREKATSRLRRGDRLTVAEMAADLCEFIRQSVTSARYGIIAVSMGAVLALKAFADLDQPPAWIALLQPHLNPPVPAVVELFRPMGERRLGLVRAAMLPPARRVHRRRAGTPLGGLYRTLRTADPAKMRDSLLSWRRDPGLDPATLRGVTCPCLVVGAAGDRLHPDTAARRIANLLPGGAYLDGGTFAWTHSPEMVTAVLSWSGSAAPAAAERVVDDEAAA
jgi:pimeloyl-ACP methyl ester carboxylesterase